LYVLIARWKRVAVVLRRGPSKLVELVRWDLTRDTFERGQWLRGHVYERRCDISPRGDLFVYFAAKHRGPIGQWTGVSRPPYFTALALWPNLGTYGGGGLFAADDHLELNHRATKAKLAEGFSVPPHFTVSPLGSHAGAGEDGPIHHQRLLRGGWRLVEKGHANDKGFDAPTWLVYDPPRVYAKARPSQPHLEIEHRLRGIRERNGPWYVEEFAVVDRTKQREELLPACEWADWDHQGDLLWASRGTLSRSRVVRSVLQPARTLIDLGGDRFQHVIAPPSARKW
jgi:hypothetical protein